MSAHPAALTWHTARLEQLGPLEATAMFRLRQRVFVLEQRCLYGDIDDIDTFAWHLRGLAPDGALLAYLRIIPPAGRYPGPAIGRVVTAPAARRGGHGRALMREGLRETARLFPGADVYLSAQTYLLGFYRDLGFEVRGEPFDEDGIEHVEMWRRCAPAGGPAPAGRGR